jgi:hypothetical protein
MNPVIQKQLSSHKRNGGLWRRTPPHHTTPHHTSVTLQHAPACRPRPTDPPNQPTNQPADQPTSQPANQPRRQDKTSHRSYVRTVPFFTVESRDTCHLYIRIGDKANVPLLQQQFNQFLTTTRINSLRRAAAAARRLVSDMNRDVRIVSRCRGALLLDTAELVSKLVFVLVLGLGFGFGFGFGFGVGVGFGLVASRFGLLLSM